MKAHDAPSFVIYFTPIRSVIVVQRIVVLLYVGIKVGEVLGNLSLLQLSDQEIEHIHRTLKIQPRAWVL